MSTPLKAARLRRKLTRTEVAQAVETDMTNLYRIEEGHHAPRPELARKLYTYYRGDVHYIDILDPTFFDEVGLIEPTTPGDTRAFRVRTRRGEFKATGLNGLRHALSAEGVLDAWDVLT